MCVVGKHFRYVSYSSQQAKVEMMWACQNAETAHQQTPSSNSPILPFPHPPILLRQQHFISFLCVDAACLIILQKSNGDDSAGSVNGAT